MCEVDIAHFKQGEMTVITDRIDSVTRIPEEYLKAAPPAPMIFSNWY